MPNNENVLMFKAPYDLDKIKRLEKALLEYVERYGLSESAREALSQLEEIQTP